MADRGKGFPRISLASAVQIMDAASKFGKSWKKEQFASFGAKNNAGSVKSGAFAARISALRDYGLIISDKGLISITDLAQRITKPISAQEREDAIKEAFLSVATFNDLHVSFDANEQLPREKVAEHAVFNLNVSRDSKDKFVNVFIDAGEYAGLVKYNKENDSLTLIKNINEKLDEQISSKTTTINKTEIDNVMPSFISNLNSKPVASMNRDNPADITTINEQGVNHSGEGWGITVLIKSSHRLPAELRKTIRDLLEGADSVADQFYELERRES